MSENEAFHTEIQKTRVIHILFVEKRGPIIYLAELKKQLLALKKVGKIDSFWTSNGRILVKRDATSEPTRVSSQDSVLFKLQIEPEPEGATTASAGAATSGSVVPMD